MDKWMTIIQVEKLLLRSDPKALLKSIKKDIASIRRGRKFIGYYDERHQRVHRLDFVWL